MNHMLIPEQSTNFIFTQRLEQAARCERLRQNIEKCDTMRQAILSEILLPEVRAQRLAYVAAVKNKLEARHHETHACWPFSIN